MSRLVPFVVAGLLVACGSAPRELAKPTKPAGSASQSALAAASAAPSVAAVRPLPVVVAAEPPMAGEIGSSGFVWLTAAAADGRWALVCETRKDTDHDGKVEALWGMHGELFGDEPAPFLIRASGTEELDELVSVDAAHGNLVAMRNKKMELVSIDSGARVVLRDADTRYEHGAFAGDRAAFDAEGEHLFYVRTTDAKRKRRLIVVRRLSDGDEHEIDPGPGTLVTASVSRDWVVAHVFEATPGAAYGIVAGPSGPEHTLGGRRCRGDRPDRWPYKQARWAPTAGVLAKAEPQVVLAVGPSRVEKSDDGALRLVTGAASVPLAQAGCGAVVLARSQKHESVLFACEKGGDPSELRPLWLWQKGNARALGVKVTIPSERLAPVAAAPDARVAVVRTADGDALVDLANGTMLRNDASLRATFAGKALIEHRTGSLAIHDFDANETQELPGKPPYLMLSARQGRLFAAGPRDNDDTFGSLLDLEAMTTLGRFAGMPLAVSESGWVLARTRGGQSVPRWVRPQP